MLLRNRTTVQYIVSSNRKQNALMFRQWCTLANFHESEQCLTAVFFKKSSYTEILQVGRFRKYGRRNKHYAAISDYLLHTLLDDFVLVLAAIKRGVWLLGVFFLHSPNIQPGLKDFYIYTSQKSDLPEEIINPLEFRKGGW